jgi:hypothetical protein
VPIPEKPNKELQGAARYCSSQGRSYVLAVVSQDTNEFWSHSYTSCYSTVGDTSRPNYGLMVTPFRVNPGSAPSSSSLPFLALVSSSAPVSLCGWEIGNEAALPFCLNEYSPSKKPFLVLSFSSKLRFVLVIMVLPSPDLSHEK